MLLKGVTITAILTVLGGALTLFVAFVVGLLRISENPIIRGITKVYVEIFRGTSLLVQLYWFYFVVPFFGIRLTAMQAGVLVLGLSYGAYAQEAVRSAILAVPEGQREAGIAMNMKSSQIMRHVIIPQAIVRKVPQLGNRVKGSGKQQIEKWTETRYHQPSDEYSDDWDLRGAVADIRLLYYVGLLAGTNDLERLRQTGEGRDINRHSYSSSELQQALQRPVVVALLALLRLRNTHPAFQGRFSIGASPAQALVLMWEHEAHFARLEVDLARMRAVVICSESGAPAATRVLDLTAGHHEARRGS